MTLADRLIEALVFGRPGRVLAVLVPLGLLVWLAIRALVGWALVVALVGSGLLGLATVANAIVNGRWRPW